jgi:hypothetical protein
LYMLKPNEALKARERDDLVIFSNFGHKTHPPQCEITKMIAWSAELYAMKKRTVQHMLSLMPLCAPGDFHLKATRLVLDSLKAEGKLFHNGIRHQILTAMYERDASLCEYVVKKYL